MLHLTRWDILESKLILVGAGGFGRVILEHASKNYACAFVDDGKAPGKLICDTHVLGKMNDLEKLYPEYQQLVVGIGNNKLREEIYRKAKALGYSFPNIICSSVYISQHAQIGCGCVLLNNVVVQNGGHFGDGVLVNPGVEVYFVNQNPSKGANKFPVFSKRNSPFPDV